MPYLVALSQAFFFARRFLRSMLSEKSMRFMCILCFSSIMLSTFAFALIAAIMQGFHKTTLISLQNIHPDITLQAPAHKHLNFAKLEETLKQEFGNVIAQVTPYAEAYALIESAHSSHALLQIVRVQAVDPLRDPLVRALAQTLRQPSESTFGQVLEHNKFLLGATLAEELMVAPDDTLYLFTAEPDRTRKKRSLSFEEHAVKVGALFDTGIDEFNASMVFCSLETFKKIFPEEGITALGLRTHANVTRQKVITDLKKRFNCDIFGWQELYPALFSAFKLEQTVAGIILLLVAFIAQVTTIALLIMYITHKKNTLAILQAMGTARSLIRLIFIMLGLCISLSAGLVGLLLATVTSWCIETYKLLPLPTVYYVTHVPASMTPSILLTVIISLCLVSLLAVLCATVRIQSLHVTHLLKES